MIPFSFPCSRVLAACASLLTIHAAAPADFLPPVLPWHGASEVLVASPNDPWITPAEKTGLNDTPGYDETVSYLKRLCAASRWFSLQEFGRTAQGRPLFVVVASSAGKATPEALRAGGKPTLLAQGGIHAGEIDGKDAGLMLLRDMAFRGKKDLLDRANFLFVPIFNADGHERSSEWNRPNQRGPVHQGWRTTAQNLNLNRDYAKADSPEMQAMLGLIAKWSPSLYLDLHVTDGIDYQYDITFGCNGERGVPAWSPAIGGWLDDVFRPAVEQALRNAGHTPGPLVFARNDRDLKQGLVLSPAGARFSTGYGDARHLPTVLVENHSLKPYRQRVLGTYVLLESALRVMGREAARLRDAISADESARPQSVPLSWADGGGVTNRDFLGVASETYFSPASGQQEVRWLGRPQLYPQLPVYLSRPGLSVDRPRAYWVPASKPDVIARLKLHGVRVETLKAAQTVPVTMYRLTKLEREPGEGFHPFEGRHTLRTDELKMEQRTETFPAGSVRVPTDQPRGFLAMILLEPQCADSLFAWGFFPEILQRTEYIEGYVLAPLADRMLQGDPKLKRDFEARVAADSKFAGDGYARLQWFYERSPFYDQRYLLYPVGIEGRVKP